MNVMRELTREEVETIHELEARGILATPQAVAELIVERSAAIQAQEQVLQPAEQHTRKTNWGVSVRVALGLTTPRGGRPPRNEPWLEEAAKLVAGGATLREALIGLSVQFSEQDLNNIQRLARFRHYLEKYRRND